MSDDERCDGWGRAMDCQEYPHTVVDVRSHLPRFSTQFYMCFSCSEEMKSIVKLLDDSGFNISCTTRTGPP